MKYITVLVLLVAILGCNRNIAPNIAKETNNTYKSGLISTKYSILDSVYVEKRQALRFIPYTEEDKKKVLVDTLIINRVKTVRYDSIVVDTVIIRDSIPYAVYIDKKERWTEKIRSNFRYFKNILFFILIAFVFYKIINIFVIRK